MTDVRSHMGPISYLIVEFPGGKMTGEGFPVLVELVERGVIRILDLIFVAKRSDGSLEMIDLRDLDGDGQLDLAVFEGAASGLLGESDLTDAEPPSSSPARRPPSCSSRTGGPPGSSRSCVEAEPSGLRRVHPAGCRPGCARRHGPLNTEHGPLNTDH